MTPASSSAAVNRDGRNSRHCVGLQLLRGESAWLSGVVGGVSGEEFQLYAEHVGVVEPARVDVVMPAAAAVELAAGRSCGGLGGGSGGGHGVGFGNDHQQGALDSVGRSDGAMDSDVEQ